MGSISDFILFLRIVAVALNAPAVDVRAVGLLVARKRPCIAIFRLGYSVVEVKLHRFAGRQIRHNIGRQIRIGERADVHAIFPNRLVVPPVVSARHTHRANHRLVADVAVDYLIIVQLHRRIPVRLAVHDCLGHMQQVNLQFRPCKNRSIEVAAAVRRGRAQFDVLLRFVGIPFARNRHITINIDSKARLYCVRACTFVVRIRVRRDGSRAFPDARQRPPETIDRHHLSVAALPVQTCIAGRNLETKVVIAIDTILRIPECIGRRDTDFRLERITHADGNHAIVEIPKFVRRKRNSRDRNRIAHRTNLAPVWMVIAKNGIVKSSIVCSLPLGAIV